MKKRWTDVYGYAKKLTFRFPLVAPSWNSLNEFGKMARFNDAFMRHHKNSDLTHMSKEGVLLGVTYLTIVGVDHKNDLFKLDPTEAMLNLEAENKRLREALEQYKSESLSYEIQQPDGSVRFEKRFVARDALNYPGKPDGSCHYNSK